MAKNLEFCKVEDELADNLNKFFGTKYRTGFVKWQNVLLPETFSLFCDRIQELEIRSDDIWVCSFPRTGTTWTQEMVWCIAHDADLSTANVELKERFPHLELTPQIGNSTHRNGLHDCFRDSFSYVDKLPSPRFIKSHSPFKLLPKKLQKNETNAKIIYVTRNPRDTCVSLYHHSRLMMEFSGTFENYCELFLDGNVVFGPFSNHVRGFLEQKNNLNLLILKYEDMKKDLRSVIYKTADFLGKQLAEEQVTKLMDHLTFEKMKQNRAVNKEAAIEAYKKNKMTGEEISFIRKGRVGEWKEVMNADLAQRFTNWEENYFKDLD